MQIRIFEIEEGIIRINENCLLIPELKEIVSTYEDPIPALCFVHFMTDPLGPYANLSETKREEIVFEDYPGEYTLDDEPIYKAIRKLESLYETPTMRLMKKAKIGLETLGDYLASAQIRDEDKGGNLNTFSGSLKSIGKISQDFKVVEREVQEELRIRGNLNVGYDEI